VILIKKAGDGSDKIKGCWDSIHVVEVQEKTTGRSAHYKLTSTAMLWLQTHKPGSGTMNLGGSLTRQVSAVYARMNFGKFSTLSPVDTFTTFSNRKLRLCHREIVVGSSHCKSSTATDAIFSFSI
jgi:hypothetical protein